MGIEECKLVQLPLVEDPQGNLAFAEQGGEIPFPIARVFYVYDIPDEAVRGGHAHLTLEQVLFCVAGRLDVAVRDGVRRRTFRIEHPRTGLYLPPMVWHDIGGFATGTVYLVLTSKHFDEDDYIRDYDEYLATTAVAEANV